MMLDHLFVVAFRPENVRNIYGRTWSHLLQLLLRPFTEWESTPPSLATSTTLAFPSHRRTKGEYSKSPVAVRHDGRIGLRSGWDISLASSTDLCSTTSSIRTPPQRFGLFSHLVDGLGCRAERDLADRLPLCPQIRASQRQFTPDGPFRTSRDKTVSPRRLHSFSRSNSSKLQCVWFPGSQSVQGLCSPSTPTGRSSRINAPHSPLSLARFGPRRFDGGDKTGCWSHLTA